MNQDDEPIVSEGGVWRNGEPGSPGPVPRKPGGPPFSIILPNAAERLNVPAPAELPWNGVGLINLFQNNNRVLVGSGFLCRSDVLLTAAHVLTSRPYNAAGVWMGFDAKVNPNVPPAGIRAYAVHKTLDLAVLILDAHHAGIVSLAGVPPPNGTVTLAGYAMPYANGDVRYSHAAGPVTASSPIRLAYAISTGEGDSGAPVFFVKNGVATAVAVHGAAQSGGETGNAGVRLSPTVVDDISTMIAWARAQIGES